MSTQATQIDPQTLASIIPTDDPNGSGPPDAVAPGPPPAPGGKRGNGANGQPKQTAKQVSAQKLVDGMLPSTVRVYVSKRVNGQLADVGDYSADDLAGAGTIGVFLRRHVVPKYKPGEYHLYRFDSSRPSEGMVPIGSVNILAPDEPTPVEAEKGKVSSLREMFGVMKDMQSQIQSQPAQASAFEQMGAAFTVFEKMGVVGKKGEGGGDGGQFLMLFLMMQMMNQPRQQGPDPAMMRMLERLEERFTRMEDERLAAAMIPPAPMQAAPAVDPYAPIQLLMDQANRNTQLLIEVMKGSRADRDPVKDMSDLAKLLHADKSESFTMKDMLTMVPTLRDLFLPKDVGRDPFEKTVEHIRLLKEIQSEFDGGGGESAENFWSFAKTLLTSDVGGMIANAIKAENAATVMHQNAQQRQLQRQNAAKEVSHSRANGHAPNGAANGHAVAPNGHAPTRQAKSPVQAPQAPEPEVVEEEAALVIPDFFLQKYAPAINQASADHERIPPIIDGMRALATSPESAEGWRPHVVELFGLTKVNRKEEALEKLFNILAGLAEAGAIDPDVVKVAIEDFDRRWDLIRSRLKFPETPEIGRDGKPKEVAAAPAVPTTPKRPVPETEDEDADEEAPVERPKPKAVDPKAGDPKAADPKASDPKDQRPGARARGLRPVVTNPLNGSPPMKPADPAAQTPPDAKLAEGAEKAPEKVPAAG